MSEPLRVLLIDDEPAQAWLVAEYLRSAAPGSITLTTAETLAEGLEVLDSAEHDALLLDLCLPDSLGVDSYVRLAERHPDVPVVVMTSLEDEEMGSRLVQLGAQDFVVKGQIGGPMLVRTLRYAIERRRAQTEREALIGQLRAALDEVRRLEGLLPICAWCHKIRDDEGYWQRVEVFIAERTDARFSHGICPSCMKQVCPDEAVAASWLTPLDVVDPAALCRRLRAGDDALSRFLVSRFSDETRRAMALMPAGGPADRALVESLVAELNRIIEHERVYEPERFAGVELGEALLSESTQASMDDLAERILINRRLLQAAFRGEIAAVADGA